jgi:hypothetical protein
VYYASGITASIIIDEPGVWDILCTVPLTNGAEYDLVKWREITTSTTVTADFSAQDGQVSIAGPYTADFVATVNQIDLDVLYYAWYWGDGDSDVGTGIQEQSHIYAAYDDAQTYLTFNGTTTSIDCGSDAALDDLQDAAMTVEAWIKADGLGENSAGRIICKDGAGPAGWRMFIDASGLNAQIDCATDDAEASSGAGELYADGLWHHVAFTWDDASYDYPLLWIDGVESSYDTTQDRDGAIVTDAANSVIIGNNSAGDRTWNGGIAWVRISNAVLYTKTFNPPSRYTPPATAGTTVEQWNLNDGTGTTAAAEEDTPANDGTITDGTWASFTTPQDFDVLLEVFLPGTSTSGEADAIVFKRDYVTVIETITAPLGLTALRAIAAEVAKHIGCLDDATWVQEGAPNTSVYTATVSRKWADGYTYTLKEDGQNLSSQASIAACQASAGSFYVAYSDPNLVISVHTTNSDNPNINGSVYSLRFT